MAKEHHRTRGKGRPRTVDLHAFHAVVSQRSRPLGKVAVGCLARPREEFVLTRPLLTIIQAASSQLEELLDAYGAHMNRRWYRFRARVATLKNFAAVGHELLHLDHSVQAYRIDDAAGAFRDDSRRAIDGMTCLLRCALEAWRDEAQALELPLPEEGIRLEELVENLPEGKLPCDRRGTRAPEVESWVVDLATQFLHGTEQARFLGKVVKTPSTEWSSLVGEMVSEEKLRALEARFHNLQSQYDTHVSHSTTEGRDTDLRSLRGHISAVLHLLRIGTILAHFFERHILLNPELFACHENCPLGIDVVLDILVKFCCGYAWRFQQDARHVCRQVLQCYAEIDTIELPVPAFRGFHVRPSTLVSLIVEHYGSDVVMECGGTRYNAASPMELFRANEWINQQKRDRVYAAVDELPLAEIEARATHVREAMEEAFIRLAGRKIIRIHKHPLPLEDFDDDKTPSLRDGLRTAVEHLLRLGAIDVETEITVRVTGDKRVLEDLRTLARCGYGEDEIGRNLPLPESLSYLNHHRADFQERG